MRLRQWAFASALVLVLVGIAACGNLPFGATPTPARQITFDGPVTLSLKKGETLAGTTIAYHGKAPDGRAILTINGLQALKATADSVNWAGALVLFSLVDLKLRVVAFDDSSLTFAGTIHIVVQEPNPTSSEPAPNRIADFTVPVTYTVTKDTFIPGTPVSYLGANTGSAEFANLDQSPLRERFDSVIWEGRLRERISLRVDLRIADFNDERVILGGFAKVIFEQ